MERNHQVNIEENIILQNRKKPNLRLVVLGHVDAGKTATVSRVLEKYDKINNIAQPCETEASLTREDLWKKYSMPRNPKASYLTILKLESFGRTLTFYDVSGTRDYIHNMYVALNQANAGLLVVSAAPGEFEAGVDLYAQMYVLGLKKVLVAINKMDWANYGQKRYEEIIKELQRLATKIGYQIDDVSFVPVSFTQDQNFDGPSDVSMPWYKGPTLLEALDNMKVPLMPVELPLRITIQSVYDIKDVGTVAVGQVVTGVLKVNDKIMIAPGNVIGQVKSIEANNTLVNEAYPSLHGDEVGIHFEGVSVKSLWKGSVVGHVDREPPAEVIDFTAKIIVSNIPVEIHEGYSPVIECHATGVACKITEILIKYDRRGNILEARNDVKKLTRGDNALIRLVPLKAMVVEPFSEFAALGRLIVRDMRQAIGYGTVISVNKKQI